MEGSYCKLVGLTKYGMMTNVFQNSKSFSSIQHTTAVVSYNIFIMNWNCKYACDATKMEANLNLDSSKLFFN